MNRVCAAPRGVVDDALDPRAGLGLDRHDVAAVAQRDDRLLEGVAQLRADERVEPPPQPVVGDADRRAQATEPRRGGVEQLPDRVEAAGQRRAQGRQRVQLAPEIAQERPSLVGEERGQAGRRVERRRRSRGTGRVRGDRRGPPARWPGRCRGRRRCRDPAVPGGARRPGRSRRGHARRGRDRSTARAPRPAAARARTTSRRPGVPGSAGNSSRSIERWSMAIGRVSAARPDRRPTGGRARRSATARRPTAVRRNRSRSGAWRAHRAVAHRRGARLEPQRRRRIAQVDPGPAGVEPERGGHQARPARQPLAWQAFDPFCGGGGSVAGRRCAAARSSGGRGRRASPRCPRAARRRGRARRRARRRSRSPR